MFIKKILFKKLAIWIVFTFQSDIKPRDTKRDKWPPKNIKWYKGMIESVTQHSYFEKKPDK